MDIMDAIRSLPQVGDKRMEVPTPKIYDQAAAKPQKCVVEEVNTRHLWYRVRFKKTGHCECYKVPQLRRVTE